ncbi:MAG: hypothetical protein GY765_33825 [bacterium]|nr:hypothetical protein [bacterium]
MDIVNVTEENQYIAGKKQPCLQTLWEIQSPFLERVFGRRRQKKVANFGPPQLLTSFTVYTTIPFYHHFNLLVNS